MDSTNKGTFSMPAFDNMSVFNLFYLCGYKNYLNLSHQQKYETYKKKPAESKFSIFFKASEWFVRTILREIDIIGLFPTINQVHRSIYLVSIYLPQHFPTRRIFTKVVIFQKMPI